MRRMKKVLVTVLVAVMAITVIPFVGNKVARATTLESVVITDTNFTAAGTETLSGDFDVTYTFHNVSTGTENRHNYLVELRDSDNKCIDVQADRWGWTWTGSITFFADNKDVVITDTWESGYTWDNFLSKMQEGVDVTVNVVRVGNVVTIVTDNQFCEFKFTVPFEMTSNLTIALGGEKVNLTNIKFTDNNKDGKYNMEYYRSDSAFIAPIEAGKVFAGWYEDSDFTTPIAADQKTGTAYAKFVDAALLNTACQTRAGTTADSSSADLRMMLAVDSLDYSNVGFDLAYNGKTYNGESRTVYKNITVTDNGQTVSYSPSKYFGASAEYMLSCILTGIPQSAFNSPINVTPYWTTLDGTKVSGETRTVTVSESFQTNS